MSIDFNVNEALDKLGHLIQAHGQQAVDAASSVVQMDALNELTNLPFAMILLTIAWFVTRRWLKWLQADDGDSELPAIVGFPVAGIWLFAAFWTYQALFTLLNVWTWVALFNPHLALAHRVLQKLGGV